MRFGSFYQDEKVLRNEVYRWNPSLNLKFVIQARYSSKQEIKVPSTFPKYCSTKLVLSSTYLLGERVIIIKFVLYKVSEFNLKS